MTSLTHLCLILNRLICLIGRSATWAALALMLVIIFDVVSRRFFVVGSTKLQELEWHLHIVLFILCLGYGYLANAHVRIDLFRERLSRRAQQWVELLGCLFFVIPYCGILFYLGINFSIDSYLGNEVSSAGTGLSNRWIIKGILAAGLGILMLTGVSVVLRQVILLFGSSELTAAIEESLQRDVGLAQDDSPEEPDHI